MVQKFGTLLRLIFSTEFHSACSQHWFSVRIGLIVHELINGDNRTIVETWKQQEIFITFIGLWNGDYNLNKRLYWWGNDDSFRYWFLHKVLYYLVTYRRMVTSFLLNVCYFTVQRHRCCSIETLMIYHIFTVNENIDLLRLASPDWFLNWTIQSKI